MSNRLASRFVDDLTCRRPADTQTHIKKGGYRNLEVFYDDYLVRLIQAKLLSNQTNQGKSSDIMKSIVKADIKNEETTEQKYIYSAKEIWELSNTSKQTWYNFVSEFLSKVDFTQKEDYLEEHHSRSGGLI